MLSTINSPTRKYPSVDSADIAKAKYDAAFFGQLAKTYDDWAVDESDPSVLGQIEAAREQCRGFVQQANAAIAEHRARIALRRKMAARRVAAVKRALNPRPTTRARRPARRPAKAALASASSSDGPHAAATSPFTRPSNNCEARLIASAEEVCHV